MGKAAIRGYRYPRNKAFPAWGRQRGGGFAAKKGSQPRLAALGSPFQRKGLAWTLPPSIGRRRPEGAEVGWGKQDEKIGEDRLKYAVCESTLSTADAVPLPQWGRLRYEDTAFLDTTPFPKGKAKRRRLRRKKGSQPRLAALGSPFQGKGLAWMLPPSYERRRPEGADKDKMFCRSL